MTPLLVAAAVTAVLSAVRGMWSPCGLSMLTSLNPVAERARGHQFWATAGWYVAGAVVGGAALGSVAAAAAWAWGAPGLPVVAVAVVALLVAAAGVVSDSPAVRWALPDHPRQVDERWLDTYRRWIYAGGYGVQIGTGFATYIMTAGVYVTAALAVLTGSPLQAFVVCTGFGAARGLVITVCAGARTPERLRALLARVDALDAVSLRVAALGQAAAGGIAAGMLGGWAVGAAAGVALAALAVTGTGAPARLRRTLTGAT